MVLGDQDDIFGARIADRLHPLIGIEVRWD